MSQQKSEPKPRSRIPTLTSDARRTDLSSKKSVTIAEPESDAVEKTEIDRSDSPDEESFSSRTASKKTLSSMVASGALTSDSVSKFVVTDDHINVDSILHDNMYTIVTRFAVSDDAAYIKAISPLGDIVFIQVDRKGLSTFDIGDFTTVKSIKGTKINSSDKTAASTCTSQSTCGVALQCENELCVIVRRDDGKNDQNNFMVSESYSEKTITPVGSTIAFPIVRLSEIMLDPQGTAKRISNASKSIYDNSYSISTVELGSLMSQIDKLHKNSLKFTEVRDSHIQKHAKDIYKLSYLAQGHYTEYLKGTMSEANREKYLKVLVNIYARSRELTKIISISNTVAQLERDLIETRTRIESLHHVLETNLDFFKDERGNSRILDFDEALAL